MKADSGSPGTIDDLLIDDPIQRGIKKARELYDKSFDCDYIYDFRHIGDGRGFEVYYDMSKITVAEALKDFKQKLDDIKKPLKARPDYKESQIELKVSASSQSVKTGHFLIRMPKDDYLNLFIKGFVEGYLKEMCGIS